MWCMRQGSVITGRLEIVGIVECSNLICMCAIVHDAGGQDPTVDMDPIQL